MVNSDSEGRNKHTELFEHPPVYKLQFSSMAWNFLEKGSNGKMTEALIGFMETLLRNCFIIR